MVKNELVSIIIPAYNVENYISKTIYSAINQTYKEKEIIVINDGSTDNTLNKIMEIKKVCNDIIVIDKDNTGVSDTRNVGINKSKGKFITFFDSDDYVDCTYLEDCISIINKYNLDLINSGFYSETEMKNGKSLSTEIKYKEKLYKSKEDIKKDIVDLFDSAMLYNIWNKIYLKSIIVDNNIIFKELDFGEDIEFNKDYIKYTNRFYNLDKCYYHYVREREGATTKLFKKDFFEIRKKEFFDFNEYFEKLGISKTKYYEYSCRRYIERVIGCIENIFCSDYNLKTIYKEIKKYINDSVTIEAIKYIKPKSKKIMIMLIPIKIKSTFFTFLMGQILHVFKCSFPAIFNLLKNRR